MPLLLMLPRACAAHRDIRPLRRLPKDTGFSLKQSPWTIIYLLINAVSPEEGEDTRKTIYKLRSHLVGTLTEAGFFNLKKVLLYFDLFLTFLSE